MSARLIKIAHTNAWKELLAGLSLVMVFWFVMQVDGYLYLEGVHSYQGAMVHFIALILGLIVADRIGHISYAAVALIVLFGITGYIATDYYLFTIKTGRVHAFGPWYAYVFPSVFACMVLFWIRRIKLFFAERRNIPR